MMTETVTKLIYLEIDRIQKKRGKDSSDKKICNLICKILVLDGSIQELGQKNRFDGF